MKKMWIKFTQDHLQKAKSDEEKDQEFKKDDVIELDDVVAKSLISLGMAEETKEPEAGGELDLNALEKSVIETVETVVGSALAKVATTVEKKALNFAEAKDHNSLEADYGWKNGAHFLKGIHAHAMGNDNFPGLEFLTKSPEGLTKAPTGQNIGSDAEGNFLVPEPIADRIWSNLMEEPDSILSQTLGVTTAGTTMKLPRMFESSRKTGAGQRNGGIIAFWVEEAGTLTASKFTTGRVNLELHKLAALTYATEEMLDDSGFNIEGFFGRLVPKAINFEVGNALFNGTGVGKPQGVLKSDALIKIPATDFNGNPIPIDQMSHKAISNMYYRNSERNRASWYAHPTTMQALEFMTFRDDTTNQRPIYFPAGGMGFGGITKAPFGSMYARPVISQEFMPNINQECTIAFIDWSDYATLTKANGGLKFASSIHVRFLNDEEAFRWTFRIDGRSLWTGPREDLNGSLTRSPYTALAAVDTDEGTSSGL